MPDSNLSRVLKRIDSYSQEVFSIQKKLTAIPAIGPENGGEGEAKKATVVKDLLQSLRADELIECHAPDNRVPAGYRPNLLALFHGKSRQKTAWIMAHLDVVPPGDLSLWETDPYSAIEKEGKIYGRGTEDNQQGFVSAFLAIKSLIDENIVPEINVGLAIVSDEETGSHHGIEYVLKNRPDLFKKQDLIFIPDSGDSKGILIEVAEKSILWLKCVTHGKQTHGSTPEKGINAHKAAAHFIVRCAEVYRIYDQNDPLYDPPISTFEPTKKELNVGNINTIPGSDVIYFDCRILPSYKLEEVQETFRSIADSVEKEQQVKIEIIPIQTATAPPPTPVNSQSVKVLEKAIADVRGEKSRTIGIGGGTVAAFFRQLGLPAVCWSTLDDTLHGPNEYATIGNTLEDAKVFAHIFLQKPID